MRNGVAKGPYRFNIAGFIAGGPFYIPNKFNTSKTRLLFFVSQEYTRQRVDAGTRYTNMPTALERAGDFSKSRLISIRDPQSGQPFPGNVIPSARINPVGQAMLLRFRGEFCSIWNHTQFSAFDTTARFDANGVETNANFGAYSAARSPRIVSFALRFEF